MKSDQGVILRLTKLTDSSLIVTWCMRSEGIVKTVAKAARRPKSSFAGKLDLFFQAEVQWKESRTSELHTLKELQVAQYREHLRKNYRNMVLASYFCALVEFVMEAGQSAEELYDLLQRGLGYLENGEANLRAFHFYEKEVARGLGVYEEGVSTQTCIQRAYGQLPRTRQACYDLLYEDS